MGDVQIWVMFNFVLRFVCVHSLAASANASEQ